MKNKNALSTTLLLAGLLFACIEIEAAEPISLGADGYGKTVLDNGVTVVINQDKSTSLSAACVAIGGGVLSETPSTNGITNLMVNMLLKGNGTMNAEQISDRLDYLGATVTSNCFRDYAGISISALTENFDAALEIVSACLTSPTFPEDELTKLKVEVEGQIKGTNDNQTAASSILFWKTAFGDQGYGLPTLGTEESIKALTAENIREHYQKYVGGANVVFSIVTDLPVEKISSLLQARLGGIKPAADKVAAPAPTLQPVKTGFVSYDRNQSFIFMGFVLDRLEPKEMACVTLLHRTMGGGVGSRIWDLRQKEKLAYSVYTQWLASRYATVFRAAIGTDTSKVKQALGSLEREWGKLLADGITDAELADAKVNMKNSLIYGIDRKSGRADNMAFYEQIGYGYKTILDQIALADEITLEDVNTFVKSRLTPDRKYLSVIGKN